MYEYYLILNSYLKSICERRGTYVFLKNTWKYKVSSNFWKKKFFNFIAKVKT
jgi:hypothetical protein